MPVWDASIAGDNLMGCATTLAHFYFFKKCIEEERESENDSTWVHARERECESMRTSALIHRFTSHMPATAGAGLGQAPGSRRTIQLPHVGGRSPVTRAVTAAFQRCTSRSGGLNPGLWMSDVGVLTAKPNGCSHGCVHSMYNNPEYPSSFI